MPGNQKRHYATRTQRKRAIGGPFACAVSATYGEAKVDKRYRREAKAGAWMQRRMLIGPKSTLQDATGATIADRVDLRYGG